MDGGGMSKIDGSTALAAVTLLQMLEKTRVYEFPNPAEEEKWLAENYRKCLQVVTGSSPTIVSVPWYADDIESSVKDLRNILSGMFHLEREDIECYDCEFTDHGWIGFSQNPARNFLAMTEKEQQAVMKAIRQKAESK